MTPIEFSQSNTVYAKDQPQYNPLPAYHLRAIAIIEALLSTIIEGRMVA